MGIQLEIMKRFDCTAEVADRIRDYIDDEIGIDWSESSQRTINSAYDEAAVALGVKK